MVNAWFHSATIGALRAAARDRQHTQRRTARHDALAIVVGEASLHKRCPRRLSPVTNALPASLGCHREFEGREQSSHAYRQYESSLPRTKHRGAWLGTPSAETRFPTRRLLDTMRREDKSVTCLKDHGEQEHLRCFGSQRHSSPPPDARDGRKQNPSSLQNNYPVTAGARQARPDGL